MTMKILILDREREQIQLPGLFQLMESIINDEVEAVELDSRPSFAESPRTR